MCLLDQETESEEEEKAPEPTEFTVKLTAFSDTAKVKLIKEIKAMIPGMNLVQVCDFEIRYAVQRLVAVKFKIHPNYHLHFLA